MKKSILIIFIGTILLTTLTTLIIASDISNNNKFDSQYTNSWTKAICNETHCQDYQIYCNKQKFVSQSPLTGAVIKIPAEWEDPRSEEDRERVCDF